MAGKIHNFYKQDLIDKLADSIISMFKVDHHYLYEVCVSGFTGYDKYSAKELWDEYWEQAIYGDDKYAIGDFIVIFDNKEDRNVLYQEKLR